MSDFSEQSFWARYFCMSRVLVSGRGFWVWLLDFEIFSTLNLSSSMSYILGATYTAWHIQGVAFMGWCGICRVRPTLREGATRAWVQFYLYFLKFFAQILTFNIKYISAGSMSLTLWQKNAFLQQKKCILAEKMPKIWVGVEFFFWWKTFVHRSLFDKVCESWIFFESNFP